MKGNRIICRACERLYFSPKTISKFCLISYLIFIFQFLHAQCPKLIVKLIGIHVSSIAAEIWLQYGASCTRYPRTSSKPPLMVVQVLFELQSGSLLFFSCQMCSMVFKRFEIIDFTKQLEILTDLWRISTSLFCSLSLSTSHCFISFLYLCACPCRVKKFWKAPTYGLCGAYPNHSFRG